MSHLDPDSVELHAQGQGAAAEHLAQCAECRQAVEHSRARRRILGGLAEPRLHEAAYARVEHRLFDAPPRRRWLLWIPALGLSAALAALIVFVRAPREVVTAPPAVAVARAEPVVPAVVTLVEGEVEREGEQGWTPLDPARPIEPGEHVRTRNGRLAVSFSPSRGMTLEPNGSVLFTRLQSGKVWFHLPLGQAYCEVAPLARGEEFELLAGTRLVRVVGTAFAVNRQPGSVEVEVDHGTVSVSDGSGEVLVKGPGRWVGADGAPLGPAAPSTLSAPEAAALHGDPAWALAGGSRDGALRLDVLDLPLGATVELDQLGWGPAPATVWLAPGTHWVRARVKGEAERVSEVKLFGPTRLALPPPAEKKPPPLDARLVAAVTSVERSHHRELAYCYDHALKRNPTTEGRVLLELTVSPQGAVDEATAGSDHGGTLPDELSACLLESARGWTFPPGTPSPLELPLNLEAK